VSGHAYPFDTADPAERRRLDAHAELWDPFTFRTLEATGIGEGWRCLEIGAGTGTVAAWLQARVGQRGMVVATDIETRWLEPMADSNLVVRHHNVDADPLDADGYDLIHARLVLEHLPQRDAVVAKLAAALRPGGWLVVQDYDTRTMAFADPPHDAWTACAVAVPGVMQRAGSDPICGSQLVGLLRRAGLADVTAEGYLRRLPIPDLAPVFRPALEALRQPLSTSGAVTAAEVDAALAAFDDDDPPTTTYTPILVAASGRRPA
jgi:SAM-dependent methyltransferase